MTYFIDIHTHSCKRAADYEVVAVDITDWDGLLLTGYPECRFSVGIHPYHSATVDLDACLARLEKVLTLPRVVALGEVGLDRSISLPLPIQQRTFEAQLQLANRYAKPLIIHAVRTIPEILALLKQYHFGYPFVFHGFIGKPDMVDQVCRHGGYVSFGARVLESSSWDSAIKRAYECNVLLLETDTSEIGIKHIYEKVAKLLRVDIEELALAIERACKNIFNL